jgi:hypothetical protein
VPRKDKTLEILKKRLKPTRFIPYGWVRENGKRDGKSEI